MAAELPRKYFDAFKEVLKGASVDGPVSLNTAHLAHSMNRDVLDAAAERVKGMEEWLNHPGSFAVPVIVNFITPSHDPAVDAAGNQHGVAIGKDGDRWRIVVLRWNATMPVGVWLERPWLEATPYERTSTLARLPELFERLHRVAMATVTHASEAEKSLKSMDETLERLRALNVRTAEAIDAEESARRDWDALGRHFAAARDDVLHFTFAELGALVPDKKTGKPAGLPPSAKDHRAWWTDSERHTHTRAWSSAGFRVTWVDMKDHRVGFGRVKRSAGW